MYNAKMQNAMHDDKQIFWIFWNKMRYKKKKNDSTTPRLCKHTQAALKQSTKVKRNLPLKKRLWSEIEVYTDSGSIKGDSAIIKIHPTTIQLPI